MRCQSVDELATVSGLSSQNIIMHLLSLEDETPVVTKGPYNGLFSRKDQNGFSIDVKATVGTLLESGLLVLKVSAESGPALICLDLRFRRSGAYTADDEESGDFELPRHIVHSQGQAVMAMVCLDPPDYNDKSRDVIFRRQKICWERVIGLYRDVGRQVR